MAKDEKKTISVNEIEYNLDDLTDEQKTLLNHVQDLERKLNNATVQHGSTYGWSRGFHCKVSGITRSKARGHCG